MEATHKPTVLLLDDEHLLVDVYRIAFEKCGYEVSTFYDTDDALVALRRGFSPDVILFDITMPNSRSGYEFIETISSEKLVPHSLKIALTNEGQDGEMKRMAELGAQAHLLKANYLPLEIVGQVEKMLSQKQS